jgi:vanillate O-demethylase monooxygenase subunit
MPTGLEGKPVNRFSEAKFVSPALHRAFAKIVDPRDEGLGPRTYRFNITHIFTPQTQHSIHYWWFCSRDFKHDEPAIDEHLLSASQQAYKEDVDALEWIMENILSDAEPQFDLHFAPDKPGLMMRQYLHQLSTLEGN